MSLNVLMAFVYLSIYLFIVILKSLSPQVLNEEYPVRLFHAHSVGYYLSEGAGTDTEHQNFTNEDHQK